MKTAAYPSGEAGAIRAVTFVAGNQGGLYQLLSLFVAWECRRRQKGRTFVLFVVLVLAGLLMTQSTPALLAFGIALTAGQALAAQTAIGATVRFAVVVASIAISRRSRDAVERLCARCHDRARDVTPTQWVGSDFATREVYVTVRKALLTWPLLRDRWRAS